MHPQIIVRARAADELPLPSKLHSVPTAAVLDADVGAAGIGSPIAATGGASAFSGVALTVTYGSLAQWKALDLAKAGDVIVIATQNRRDCAEFGAVFVEIAKAKGVAAIVTDGLLRDKDEIAALGLPVFAAGTHPSSPPDPECGTVGMPVTIAGIQISTGDAVIGDSDGIAVVSRARFADVEHALSNQTEKEYALHDSGNSLPPALFDLLASFQIVEFADGAQSGTPSKA